MEEEIFTISSDSNDDEKKEIDNNPKDTNTQETIMISDEDNDKSESKQLFHQKKRRKLTPNRFKKAASSSKDDTKDAVYNILTGCFDEVKVPDKEDQTFIDVDYFLEYIENNKPEIAKENINSSLENPCISEKVMNVIAEEAEKQFRKLEIKTKKRLRQIESEPVASTSQQSNEENDLSHETIDYINTKKSQIRPEKLLRQSQFSYKQTEPESVASTSQENVYVLSQEDEHFLNTLIIKENPSTTKEEYVVTPEDIKIQEILNSLFDLDFPETNESKRPDEIEEKSSKSKFWYQDALELYEFTDDVPYITIRKIKRYEEFEKKRQFEDARNERIVEMKIMFLLSSKMITFYPSLYSFKDIKFSTVLIKGVIIDMLPVVSNKKTIIVDDASAFIKVVIDMKETDTKYRQSIKDLIARTEHREKLTKKEFNKIADMSDEEFLQKSTPRETKLFLNTLVNVFTKKLDIKLDILSPLGKDLKLSDNVTIVGRLCQRKETRFIYAYSWRKEMSEEQFTLLAREYAKKYSTLK